MDLYSRHHISMSAMECVVKVLNKAVDCNMALSLPTFKTLRSRAYEGVPNVLLDFEYQNLSSGQTTFEEGKDKIPDSVFENRREVKLLYTLSYVELEEVLRFHTLQHEAPTEVILSADNVPVNSSSQESFDLPAIQFPPCKHVYPLRLYHCMGTSRMNQYQNLRHVLHEVLNAGLRLTCVICDLPKKASLLGMKQAGGYYACFQCHVTVPSSCPSRPTSAPLLTTVYASGTRARISVDIFSLGWSKQGNQNLLSSSWPWVQACTGFSG